MLLGPLLPPPPFADAAAPNGFVSARFAHLSNDADGDDDGGDVNAYALDDWPVSAF